MGTLNGIPVSPGIAIGHALVRDEAQRHIPVRSVPQSRVPGELERLDAALDASVAALTALHAEAVEEIGDEPAKIFLFHIGALKDPKLTGEIRTKIESERIAAEAATDAVFRAWIDRFTRKANASFGTKVSDFEDLRARLLSHLLGRRLDELRIPGEDTVVIARDITPSQAASFDKDKVVAIVTDYGGPTSHTAIVARALGMPAIVGARRASREIRDGQRVLVDADRGVIVPDPDEETIARAQRRQVAQAQYRITLSDLVDLPARTTDDVDIELLGNIEFPGEADTVLEHGGQGVGLYRTEFLYLTSSTTPSEKTHFQSYASCIEKLGGRPLTIRTVDLGADKYTQQRTEVPERNPFLGLRSIRYCLQNLDMFRSQLHAILRASALGPVKIMFPLISSLDEFRQARMLVHDAMEDLEDRGEPFDKDVPIGMMVETPSAALSAPALARGGELVSIGTNDLVQYTLAVDRTNERVANLYNPAHPAVLRLIRDVSRAGRRAEIPVSCCGEAAGVPEYAALLLGLGVRTLSVTPSSIAPIKRLIRSLSVSRCERLAKKAISLDSEAEAQTYLRERIRRMVPEAFDGRTDEDG